MYGASLYGAALYCPFGYTIPGYGEIEPHPVLGGISSLAVPGGEMPSSVAGEILIGSLSESPPVNIVLEDASGMHPVSVSLTSIAVPGMEAPSTTEGVLLEHFVTGEFGSPNAPQFMFSRTYVWGTPNPYLYDTRLYDDRVLEDPFTTYSVTSYNTGLAIATCLVGGEVNSLAGGFTFTADKISYILGSKHLAGVAVSPRTDVMEFLTSEPWNGDAGFSSPADIVDVTEFAQEMPHIPQLERGAASIPGMLTPDLDTTTIIPMSFVGTLMQIFESPVSFPSPTRMATDKNGLLYIPTSSQQVIYGSKHTYVSRAAHYLGVSNWNTIYIDGNKLAGDLARLKEGSLDCGASAVDPIPVDYLFGLHNMVAVESWPVSSPHASDDISLPVVQYGMVRYLGRSAAFLGLYKQLSMITASTISLIDPSFGNADEPLVLGCDVIGVEQFVELYPAPVYDDAVFPLWVQEAAHGCDRSDLGVQYADVSGMMQASFSLPSAQYDESVFTMHVGEAEYALDSTVALGAKIFGEVYSSDGYDIVYPTDLARANVMDIPVAAFMSAHGMPLSALLLHVENYEDAGIVIPVLSPTMHVVELSTTMISTDSASGVNGHILTIYGAGDIGEAPQVVLEVILAGVSEAAISTMGSMFIPGVVATLEHVHFFDGSTREENTYTLSTVYDAVFDCSGSPIYSVGEIAGTLNVAGSGDMFTFDLTDSAHELHMLLGHTRGDFSYMFVPAGEELLLVTIQDSESSSQPFVYEMGVSVADFVCGQSSTSAPAEATGGVIGVMADIRNVQEDTAYEIGIDFADAGVIESYSSIFVGYHMDVIAFFEGFFYTQIRLLEAVSSCESSPGEFDGDMMHECVYINLTPTPFWYDFVIEYDYGNTDPGDMAFIF